MTPKKFTNKQMKKRFAKISEHIIQKNSPSDKPNNMAVQDEEEAEDQEGKKTKYRNVDLTDSTFK